MENLLNHVGKFEQINLKNNGLLSFAANQELRVDNTFKELVMYIVYLGKQADF